MPRSSASLRCAPPGAGTVHASKVHPGPGIRKAEDPRSAIDTEQDDRPTQRRIPIGQRDPRPENTRTIVLAAGEVHTYGPGAQCRGCYPNTTVAQRRLVLFVARQDTPKPTRSRGDVARLASRDQPDGGPSAAAQ